MDIYLDVGYILNEGGKPEKTLIGGRKLKHEAKINPSKRYEPKKIEDNKKLDKLKNAYISYWKSISDERIEEIKKYKKENEEREKELNQEKDKPNSEK